MALRDGEYFDFPTNLGKTNTPVKRGLSGKLQRVRRKPGLEQLNVQEGDAAIPLLRNKGHIRANTWSGSTLSATDDFTTNLAQEGPPSVSQDPGRRQRVLEQQRGLWEATLPRLPVNHIGYFSSGYGLDQVHF